MFTTVLETPNILEAIHLDIDDVTRTCFLKRRFDGVDGGSLWKFHEKVRSETRRQRNRLAIDSLTENPDDMFFVIEGVPGESLKLYHGASCFVIALNF